MNLLQRSIARIKAKWAWERAQADFDRRLYEARRQHKPTRHIEAERRDYVHNALRGGK
jgi:hypothetical protein